MGDPNAGQGLKRVKQVRWDSGGKARAAERERAAEAARRAKTAAAMATVAHRAEPA